MKEYLDALAYILKKGKEREDRTGTGTIGVFGHQMRFDLSEGFPAVTTKRLAWKAVVSELLWFMEGSEDERRLAEILYDKPRSELVGKTTIWTANADTQAKEMGYHNTPTVKLLGPVYGSQWRNFNNQYIDQLSQLITNLREDPYSRRHILTAWNPAKVDRMALPPCHTLAQFHVQDGKLSCQLYQRSADMFLGVPFNIASYALFTHILAALAGYDVGELIWTGGDCHIYGNHVEQVKLQLEREPRDHPRLRMPRFNTLQEVTKCKVADFVLLDYNPMETIKAPMAV